MNTAQTQVRRPATAQEHYDKQKARLGSALFLLSAKLKTHQADQALHPKEWGYGGDLEWIASRMEELSAMMPG